MKFKQLFKLPLKLIGAYDSHEVSAPNYDAEANSQASAHLAELERSRSALRLQQQALDSEKLASQQKLNKGIARGNRRRIRGGLFGDEPNGMLGNLMSKRLG